MSPEDICPQCGHRLDEHGGVLKTLLTRSGKRCEFRDESDLTPQLIGLEGWRVEVRDVAECDCRAAEFNAPAHSEYCSARQTRRFYVGRSTGWRPCHLEIHNRRSRGGGPARKAYASVRRLYKR